MKYRQVLIMIVCILSFTACGTDQANNILTNNDKPKQVSTTNPISKEFNIKGISSCDLLTTESVSTAFNINSTSITASSQRDKNDHKICRYEIKQADKIYMVLSVNVNYNDNLEKRPNKFSKRISQAISEGLPVSGFKDKVQAFFHVKNLGTQAAYSDNLMGYKNLLFRLGEDYLINLELTLTQIDDNNDYQPQLISLANQLVNKQID